MDAHSVGEVSIRCRIRLPPGTRVLTVEFDHALISFQPAGSKSNGSGLTIAAGDCKGSLVRVAGEDWIEAPHRSWTTLVDAGTRGMYVSFTMSDTSDRDPVRLDISGLRATAGESAETAEPCQPHASGSK